MEREDKTLLNIERVACVDVLRRLMKMKMMDVSSVFAPLLFVRCGMIGYLERD